MLHAVYRQHRWETQRPKCFALPMPSMLFLFFRIKATKVKVYNISQITQIPVNLPYRSYIYLLLILWLSHTDQRSRRIFWFPFQVFFVCFLFRVSKNYVQKKTTQRQSSIMQCLNKNIFSHVRRLDLLYEMEAVLEIKLGFLLSGHVRSKNLSSAVNRVWEGSEASSGRGRKVEAGFCPCFHRVFYVKLITRLSILIFIFKMPSLTPVNLNIHA